MIWTVLGPATAEHLGYLPDIFLDSDERPAREQAADRYAHGGGWHPQEGWSLDRRWPLLGVAQYPGDPPQEAIAYAQLRDELILLFPHAYVAIVQKDGSFEMSRMD